jgi:hypothetical protein
MTTAQMLPPVLALTHTTTPEVNHRITITLPKLRLQNEPARINNKPSLVYLKPPMFHSQLSSVRSAIQMELRSPSSPSSFFDKPERKYGLDHLLQAAEQCSVKPFCLDEEDLSRKRSFDSYEKLPSLVDHMTCSMGYSSEYDIKRQRTDSAYPEVRRATHVPIKTSSNDSPRQVNRSVWKTVISSGRFPADICLTEDGPVSSKAEESSSPVKQGRWTCDEKEYAEQLIVAISSGEVALPPNVSLRKFIADSLHCKAMRVSKKFRSLQKSQDNSSRSEDFNPLSLKNIMNSEDTHEDQQPQRTVPSSPTKKSGRTLKRSDYSQHGVVRSGRWSTEEENYAKAMIEAFKNGYLPLHGNVSLRKFLSEVLVCHPMRISKKFVGYVRKYHWYRIAAGKADPSAKQASLEELARLETSFWNSISQQNNGEWIPNRHP